MYRRFGQENLEAQVEFKKKMVDLLEMEKKQEKEKRMFDLKHNLELLDMIQSKESIDLLDSVISSVQDFVIKYKESVYTKGKNEVAVQTVDVGNCPYKKVDISKDIHLGSLSGLKNEKDHSSVYNVGNNGVQLKGGRRVMTGVHDFIRGSLPADAEKETKLDKVYGRPVNIGACRYKTLGGTYALTSGGGSDKEASTTRDNRLTLPSDVSTIDGKGQEDNKKSYAYCLGKPKSDANVKHKGNYRVYSDEQLVRSTSSDRPKDDQPKTLKDKEVNNELSDKHEVKLHYCSYERRVPTKMVEDSTKTDRYLCYTQVGQTINDCNRRKRIEMCRKKYLQSTRPPHNWTAKDLINAKRMLKQVTLPESKTAQVERPHTSYGCKPKRGIFVPWYKLHWKNSIKRDDEKEERIGSFISFPKQCDRTVPPFGQRSVKHHLNKRSRKEFSEDQPLVDHRLDSVQTERLNSFINFSTPKQRSRSPKVHPLTTSEDDYVLSWDEDDVDDDVINFIPRNPVEIELRSINVNVRPTCEQTAFP